VKNDIQIADYIKATDPYYLQMTTNIDTFDTFFFTKQHHHYMQQALLEAEQAFMEDEVPVGAVIVHNGHIVGKGYNQVERLKDPTAHAEILAISAACQTLDSKLLSGCSLYVTLEPCPMCAGALVLSRLDRIIYSATDPKMGACGSIYDIIQDTRLNHQIEVIQGIMENESEALLKKYFQRKRK